MLAFFFLVTLPLFILALVIARSARMICMKLEQRDVHVAGTESDYRASGRLDPRRWSRVLSRTPEKANNQLEELEALLRDIAPPTRRYLRD